MSPLGLSSAQQFKHTLLLSGSEKTCLRYSGGGGGRTPYDGLYEVYERVGISLVEVYKRVGTSVIYGFIKSRKRSIFVIDSY